MSTSPTECELAAQDPSDPGSAQKRRTERRLEVKPPRSGPNKRGLAD